MRRLVPKRGRKMANSDALPEGWTNQKGPPARRMYGVLSSLGRHHGLRTKAHHFSSRVH